jgi:hypothetical protein
MLIDNLANKDILSFDADKKMRSVSPLGSRFISTRKCHATGCAPQPAGTSRRLGLPSPS